MVDGEPQNIQGFPSDMPVIIMQYATPYRYCINTDHPLTKVTYPAVSTDTNTKDGVYYGKWRNPAISGLLVGQPSHHH